MYWVYYIYIYIYIICVCVSCITAWTFITQYSWIYLWSLSYSDGRLASKIFFKWHEICQHYLSDLPTYHSCCIKYPWFKSFLYWSSQELFHVNICSQSYTKKCVEAVNDYFSLLFYSCLQTGLFIKWRQKIQMNWPSDVQLDLTL